MNKCRLAQMARFLVVGGIVASALWSTPMVALAQPPEAAESEEKDKLPTIDKVTEKMRREDGFLPLWIDEKRDLLYAEVPDKLVNKDFLVSVSLSAGRLAGLQLDSTMIRFERQDKNLLLLRPNVFYRADGELEKVVSYTYPDEVLTSVKLLAESGGNVLIDLKALLASQAGTLAYGVQPGVVTTVNRAKSFENNTIVDLRFRGAGGGTGVYYSLGALPEKTYKTREADPRVGYFITAQTDFSKDPRDEDTFRRYINRWKLEKQDPELDLTPPKEPIVMYIEYTVPVRYRRWVREGILEWNKAFEQIGIVDAIEVRQQTETNEFKGFDPEDSRHNFFRWIASERAFAIAPSRVDPRTGQILDSDILFDDSMVRSYISTYRLMYQSAPALDEFSPRLRQWVASNPWQYPNWNRLALDYKLRIDADPSLAGTTPEQLFHRDLMGGTGPLAERFRFCTIGQEIGRELAFADLSQRFALFPATAATPDAKKGSASADEKKKDDEKDDEDSGSADDEKNDDGEESGDKKGDKKRDPEKDPLAEWPEEFIGPIIKQIVAHEMGHTLGLRHNFKASSWKSYEAVLAETDPTKPTSGSVMDYNPFYVKADGTKPASYVTTAIGPYDYWAIEYGYAVPGTGDYPRDEKETLKKITARVTEDGHAYGTDEDVSSPDPLIARFDMGDNNMDYYQARMALADKIIKDLLNLAVRDGESFARAREAFDVLLAQRYVAASNATKFIGGYSLVRDHKGDPGARPPITVVPVERQRQAMDVIVASLFKKDAIVLDPKVLNHLSASRWYHEGSSDFFNPLTYPIQDIILSYQSTVLFRLMNPERIQYLYDAEFNVDQKTEIYTLPEMFDTLTGAIWTEVLDKKYQSGRFTTREPMIDNLRRNAQREYLGRLITIATDGEQSMYPAVARTLAWSELKKLGEKIDAVLAAKDTDKLDAYTAAHLQESSTRIQRALNATYTIGGANPGLPFFLFFGQPAPGAAAQTNNAPMRDGGPLPMGPY